MRCFVSTVAVAVAVAVAGLSGCRGTPGKPTDPCSFVIETFKPHKQQSDCSTGLMCLGDDTCEPGWHCSGHCGIPCVRDAGTCPDGCLCTSHLSTEYGDGYVCRGSGCSL